MERLTKRKEENGQRWIELRCCADCSECCDCEDIWMALDRLAAYEDTGLTPEEVAEIAKAKADGRCVVLPCKVGEIVYVPTSQVCDDCIISGVIQYFVVYETFTDAAVIFNQGASDAFIARVKTENIGKTVFLTREAAEAARKEQEK